MGNAKISICQSKFFDDNTIQIRTDHTTKGEERRSVFAVEARHAIGDAEVKVSLMSDTEIHERFKQMNNQYCKITDEQGNEVPYLEHLKKVAPWAD